MLLRVTIAIMLLIPFVKGSAQLRFNNEADSLLFAQADSVFAMWRHADSALTLAKALLAKSNTSTGIRSVANIHNAIGWTYFHKAMYDSSTGNLQKAWQLFSKAKDTAGVIRVCINISEVYTRQNKIADAIQYLMQADSLCEVTQNTVFHTNVQRQLGVVYREAKDYKRATFYLNRAFTEFLKLKDYYRYVSTGISLSILYRSLQLPDSSLLVLKQCLAILSGQTKETFELAMVQEHVGETYYQTKSYGNALEHFSSAYQIFKKFNSKPDIAYEAMNMGKVLWKLQRIPEAEKYMMEAYKLSDSLKILNYQYDAVMLLADMHGQNSNWQKAYHYLNTAAVLKDSIDVSDQIQRTNELKEKFEAEKKEKEIALLKTQNSLTTAENRKSRLLQYLFGVLFVTATVIGWLLYNRVRMKRKLNEQLLRNQLAGDLHDDIGSALSAIDISSRIALAKKEDPVIVGEQLKKINQYTAGTMESMSDIVWSVNPRNDNVESVMTRVHAFATELCEPLQIETAINMSNGLDRLPLDANKRKQVLLLCKEAINNAVKYSGCTKLQISSKVADNGRVQITIADNGKGFDPASVKRGNGLMNMEMRSKTLDGNFLLNASVTNGVSVRFEFPV